MAAETSGKDAVPPAHDAALKRISSLGRHAHVRRSPVAAAGGGAGGAGRELSDGELNLIAERARATFDAREMTYFLDGGRRLTAFKEKAMADLEKDPCWRMEDRYDLDRQGTRKRVLEKCRATYRTVMHDSSHGGSLDLRKARQEIGSLADMSWVTRTGVHFGLFMGAITSQGTDEQQQEWLPQLMMLNVYGCFGMTEMGHGSHVRGIETVATYVPESREFELHTPSVTATKWWIGAAGQTATHCSVFARLITADGVDRGVHCFVVQLRDMETHAPMPGVTVGDCGSKMGRDGIDNGWIQFNRVRVPREAMLMKHAQVAEDGTYTKPPKAAVAYGALLLGRATLVKDSGDVLKMALTIAVRYSCVRRQGEPLAGPDAPGAREPQLLDYRTMQARLFPLLATAYAFHFTSKFMVDLHERFQDASTGRNRGSGSGSGSDSSSGTSGTSGDGDGDGDGEGADGGSGGDDAADMLPDVHATSAGLKAYCTWFTLDAIERCRQTLGGHGYSSYSGLPGMYADFAVMCTWEGDNTVMALQTARYLVASLRKAAAGGAQAESLRGSVRYLVEPLPRAWRVAKPDDLRDAAGHLAAMRFQAKALVQAAASALDACRTARGMTEGEAWNECSPELLKAARAHVYLNISSFFLDGVERREAEEEGDPSLAGAGVGRMCRALCELFMLQYLREEAGFFLGAGFMTSAQLAMVDADVRDRLYPLLRANAVALVDAFNISDFVHNSPCGRRDGNVYEHYFERVKAAPLAQATAPYYASTIRPMLEGADLQGGGGEEDGEDEDDRDVDADEVAAAGAGEAPTTANAATTSGAASGAGAVVAS